MRKRVIKLLKLIVVLFIVVLIVETIYIWNLTKEKSIYFDSINSIIDFGKGYVAVGSNNNNDQYFEKAKITKYNSKKEKKFERIYNKGYNSVFFDVVSDDEYLVAVGSYEADDKEHETGTRTALIVKYDKDGNLIYENSFQILGNSKFTSIIKVDDGYIVTGQSVYDDMVVGLSEDGGAFIIKYNKELEIEWKSNFGDSKTAIYNDVVVENDTIYVVGGNDSSVGVIAKYDMDGSLVKVKTYEYTDNLGFMGIISSNDNLFVSTSKRNNDGKELDFDAAIIQYNLDLEIDDEITYSGNGFSRYNRIITDKHDNIVVIGTISIAHRNDTVEGLNVFSHDGIIAKYDKNLEKISVVSYGDEKDDYFTDIIVSDGDYLVSGYSSYEDGSYLSKFITYSDALKILGVK